MGWDYDIPIEEQLLTERILMLTHSIDLLRCGVYPIHREAISVIRKQIEYLKSKPIQQTSKGRKKRPWKHLHADIPGGQQDHGSRDR
jgi:hypothetical protein